jgi:hypothetical protein
VGVSEVHVALRRGEIDVPGELLNGHWNNVHRMINELGCIDNYVKQTRTSL